MHNEMTNYTVACPRCGRERKMLGMHITMLACAGLDTTCVECAFILKAAEECIEAARQAGAAHNVHSHDPTCSALWLPDRRTDLKRCDCSRKT